MDTAFSRGQMDECIPDSTPMGKRTDSVFSPTQTGSITMETGKTASSTDRAGLFTQTAQFRKEGGRWDLFVINLTNVCQNG
jgi:hypothetical protein